jgi:hypothetical protein
LASHAWHRLCDRWPRASAGRSEVSHRGIAGSKIVACPPPIPLGTSAAGVQSLTDFRHDDIEVVWFFEKWRSRAEFLGNGDDATVAAGENNWRAGPMEANPYCQSKAVYAAGYLHVAEDEVDLHQILTHQFYSFVNVGRLQNDKAALLDKV